MDGECGMRERKYKYLGVCVRKPEDRDHYEDFSVMTE
jgi:hypothetical protein